MISDLRKEEYFCAKDWTGQTGLESPREFGFSTHGISRFCLAVGRAMREIAH
jgi:hypothetical protein